MVEIEKTYDPQCDRWLVLRFFFSSCNRKSKWTWIAIMWVRVRKINGSLRLVDSHLGWNSLFLDSVPLLAFHERAGVKMKRKQNVCDGRYRGKMKGEKKNGNEVCMHYKYWNCIDEGAFFGAMCWSGGKNWCR